MEKKKKGDCNTSFFHLARMGNKFFVSIQIGDDVSYDPFENRDHAISLSTSFFRY